MSTAVGGMAKWAALLLALAGMVLGLSTAAVARGGSGETATIYLMPHADDEFQFWSLFEEGPPTTRSWCR